METLADGVAVDERWRTAPAAPNYEVSTTGRVRRKGATAIHSFSIGPCGFRTFLAMVDGKGGLHLRIGTQVAAAFLGPKTEGAEVRRLNGDTLDDRLENLAYGTEDDVAADHAARARREEAAGAATHCPAGHRYEDSWLGNWGQRVCRPCRRVPGRIQMRRWRAKHPEQRREADRRYWASNRERFRHRPTTTPCIDCGVGVQQYAGPGGTILRCPTCRAANKVARNHGKRRRQGDPPAVRTGVCRDCGRPVKPKIGVGGRLAERCEPCRRARRLTIKKLAPR